MRARAIVPVLAVLAALPSCMFDGELKHDLGTQPEPLDDGWSTGELFPDAVKGLDPRKKEIELRHLLTMRSGIAFDNDVFSVEMWTDEPSHPLRYMLAKPLYADPGERFYYRDVDPQIVGYALDELTGERGGELVAKHLFRPLGIDDYYRERGPDGVYLAAHGLHLRPRDLAKLGQLLLERGVWEGDEVVSEE